jgi:hypothetical protein
MPLHPHVSHLLPLIAAVLTKKLDVISELLSDKFPISFKDSSIVANSSRSATTFEKCLFQLLQKFWQEI